MCIEFTESSKRLDEGKLWLSKLPGDAITFADETGGSQFINSKYAESSSISEKENIHKR